MTDIEPILGVIFDFNNDDLYFAHHKSPAYLNDISFQFHQSL